MDEETLEELEETLIQADIGVPTALDMIKKLREATQKEKNKNLNAEWLNGKLKGLISDFLESGSRELALTEDGTPAVYLVIGVNGVGKTTSIGKLAQQFRNEGKSVMLVAGDTFRAAAIQQLEIWAERSGSDFVRGQENADPSSIVFDGISAAVARKVDIVLIDTAGRLHTKTNLMKELDKINRVISRHIPSAPHETLLVLDASTGQNGLVQAKIFTECTGVTGIILTKLDGTAKGGVTLAIHHELKIPVKYIGIGEGIDDLNPFDPETFAEALFAE